MSKMHPPFPGRETLSMSLQRREKGFWPAWYFPAYVGATKVSGEASVKDNAVALPSDLSVFEDYG